jgi:hypothetical protein
MADAPDKPKGQPPIPRRQTWVQTDRAAHEAWGDLAVSKPRAAALLHKLVALMQPNSNVVVVSMADIALILGCAERTAYRAADDLVDGRWIQRVKISGNVYGWAVNADVAWSGFRSGKYEGGVFAAAVVAPRASFTNPRLGGLRRVPILFPPDEKPLASENGGEPGRQTQIPGFETSCEVTPEDLLMQPRGDVELDQVDLRDGLTVRQRRKLLRLEDGSLVNRETGEFVNDPQ